MDEDSSSNQESIISANNDAESLISNNEDSVPSSQDTGSQRPSRRCKTLAMQGLKQDSKKAKNQQEEGEEEEFEENQDEGGARKKMKKKNNEIPGKRGRRPGSKNAVKKNTPQKVARLPKQTVARQQTGGWGDGSQMLMGDGCLFDVVKKGVTPLQSVVDEWIESYKTDKDAAMLTLIQFLIHSSGCKGTVTTLMYTSMEHADIIRKMTEQFDEDSADYPIIMGGVGWRKFRSSLCEFVSCLVRQCQYSIIYDQYMMDNVISLITGLTDSQVRAFRHTSTLCAMKLMTALVDVALNLSISLDHTQRQYEAERAKTKAKQAQDRLDLLMEKRKEIEENQEEIRHMLTYIFKGVFVHRYRDIHPEIRVICTSEIGVWMKRYPTMFLDDSYLKYIGWTLYDRVGEVRLCCLRCLQPLYEEPELSTKLELFTNRFKERIVEMTLDKELEVSVSAVKLLINIFKCNESILGDKDSESIYELVFTSHRPLASAAGAFLAAKLFSSNSNSSVETQQDNSPYLRDLVFFFIESELHEHGAYLVDSLWESCVMLKDWQCYTSLLLEEPYNEEDAFDDKQETSLVELMVCAVKQAATGEYPVGRVATTRKISTKEMKQVAEDKTLLTEHFITTLPLLLTKFTMHTDKINNLLSIPLHFDLHLYTTGRHEKQLDQLLIHIEAIMERHSEFDVLLSCSKVLEHCCRPQLSISDRCITFRSTLVDHIFSNFNSNSNNFFHKDPTDDDSHALLRSLHRIHAIFSCHDLNDWNMNDFFNKVFKEKRSVSKEILCKGIACYHFSIFWKLANLDTNNATEEELKQVRKPLKTIMQSLCMMLKHPEVVVQEEAYITICDLLIIFSKNLAVRHPRLSSLTYHPDTLLQDLLVAFLEERVFIEEEEDGDENDKIEGLHKRRNMLASFCKLVIYNVMRIKKAAEVFKYYIKFYNDFGDIIKHTLAKAREINIVQTSKTLALSLTQLYTALQAEFEDHKVPTNTEGFVAIKDLARRFSQSFGLDLRKIRNAIAAVHNDGILFVVNSKGEDDEEEEEEEGEGSRKGIPLNITFLEILTEFSMKLMKEDKRVVLEHLENNFTELLPRLRKCSAFNNYKHSLLIKDNNNDNNNPVVRGQVKTAKKPTRGKRKLSATSDDHIKSAPDNDDVRRSSRKKKTRMEEDGGDDDVDDDDGGGDDCDVGGVDENNHVEEGGDDGVVGGSKGSGGDNDGGGGVGGDDNDGVGNDSVEGEEMVEDTNEEEEEEEEAVERRDDDDVTANTQE